MTAERQPRADPAASSAASTHGDREQHCDTHDFRAHPHVTLKPPLIPGRRAHRHRGQDAGSDCIIKRGDGADDGKQLWGEEAYLPLQLHDGVKP